MKDLRAILSVRIGHCLKKGALTERHTKMTQGLRFITVVLSICGLNVMSALAKASVVPQCPQALMKSAEDASPTLGYSGLTPPKTLARFLELIHAIAERRLWIRDDFYTETTFRNIFGPQKITIKSEPDEWLAIDMRGLKELAPRPPGHNKGSGIVLRTYKYLMRPAIAVTPGSSEVSDLPSQVIFSAEIIGDASSLSFNSVVRIFGRCWTRDEYAEHARDEGNAQEAFNLPSLTRATGYMGNSIIKYALGAPDDGSEISLMFDPEGHLEQISGSTPWNKP